MAKSLGFTNPEEIIGTNIFDYMHSSSKKLIMEEIKERHTKNQKLVT
jgi:hypothetical protein